MKDGGGARTERLERTFLFLYYRFGKKKGIFIEVAQKRGGSIGVAGREWRLNTNGLLRFPCNRVSTCLDVWPTPDEEEEEGEGEEEGGKKRARGNSRPLCRPSSRPIQTVYIHGRIRGRSGRGNIWPTTPSRAEPTRTFSPQPLIRIRGKKTTRERKKERIRPGLLFGKGPANRVPLGNREIASDRFPRPIRPISAHLNGHLLRG